LSLGVLRMYKYRLIHY